MMVMDLINNSLRRLHSIAQKMKYPGEFDAERLRLGDSFALVPLCNFALLHYSAQLALLISDLGLEMFGTSDAKFVEGFYRVMRDLLNYQPKVKQPQFLSGSGFAEKKLSLVADVMGIIHERYQPTCKAPKARVVASSRLFTPQTQSAPANMGKVERVLPPERGPRSHNSRAVPLNLAGSRAVGERRSSNENDGRKRDSANRKLDEAECGDGIEQKVLSSFTNGGGAFSQVKQLKVVNGQLVDDDDDDERDVNEKERDIRWRDSMDSKQSSIEQKLDKVLSLVESLVLRQNNFETRLDSLVDSVAAHNANCSGSSGSSATRALDNLSARTSLLETKLTLIEQQRSHNQVNSPMSNNRRPETTKTASLDLYSPSVSYSEGNQRKLLHFCPQQTGSSVHAPVTDVSVSALNDEDEEEDGCVLEGVLDVPPNEGMGVDSRRRVLSMVTMNEEDSTENQGWVGMGFGDRDTHTAQVVQSAIKDSIGGDVTQRLAERERERGREEEKEKESADKSLLLVSETLEQQKARIEALFKETSSALRVTNKENLS